jgi:hypothetical protein
MFKDIAISANIQPAHRPRHYILEVQVILRRFIIIAVIPGAAKRTRNDGKVLKHNGLRKLLFSQKCKSKAFALLIHLIGVQERSQLLESTAEKLHFVPDLV